MEDMTLGVIYAIKKGEKSSKENVIDFMSKWSGADPKHYTDGQVKKILQMTFIDYLKTADNPSFEVWQFFNAKQNIQIYREVCPKQAKELAEKTKALDDDSEAIIVTLRAARVKENEKYVNGFRDEKEEIA